MAGLSGPTLSRIESGKRGMSVDEVEKLLDTYQVPVPQQREYLDMAERAAGRGWWQAYGSALTDATQTQIALEEGATTITNFEPVVVPGLLQTAAYARAVRSPWKTCWAARPGYAPPRHPRPPGGPMPLRLRPDIATTDTDDGLVLLDERTGRYWQLNPTGADVLHALLEGHHPDHIAHDLATRYRIDVHQAHHDVTAITDQLHTAKLVASS